MENPGLQDPRLDAFLSRLEGVKRAGAGWTAHCPAHHDRHPSLGIGTGRSGILVYCRSAGCSIRAIKEALDLPWSAFFWEGEQIKQKNMRMDRRGMELEAIMAAERLKGEAQVLATLRNDRGWAGKALELLGVGWDGERLTIPVRDEKDQLHDVLRYDPLSKDKRFKMLQGRGRSRLPFPRPESVKTGTCWLVEGEGSVFSMMSIGLKAVSLPGSAGKASGDVLHPAKFQGNGWHPAWARRFVQFPRVVCIPDCDDVGRQLMTAAAYDMRSQGIHVTVLDLGFEDGFDVGDFLKPAKEKETRRQAREILRMLDQTAMRQENNLPVARAELKFWYQWNTGGPVDWSSSEQASIVGPELETVPAGQPISVERTFSWDEVSNG